MSGFADFLVHFAPHCSVSYNRAVISRLQNVIASDTLNVAVDGGRASRCSVRQLTDLPRSVAGRRLAFGCSTFNPGRPPRLPLLKRKTRFSSNLKPTTCEYVHLFTRGHFRLRYKDGGHTMVRDDVTKIQRFGQHHLFCCEPHKRWKGNQCIRMQSLCVWEGFSQHARHRCATLGPPLGPPP